MRKRIIKLLLIAAILVLLVVAMVSYRDLQTLSTANKLVSHTHEVIEATDRAQLSLQNVEFNQRNYLMKGDISYPDDHAVSLTNMYQAVGQLEQLTADNSKQREHIQTLQNLLDRRTALFQKFINIHNKEGQVAAINLLTGAEARSLSEKINMTIAMIRQEEFTLLSQRNDSVDSYKVQLDITLILGFSAALLLFFIAFFELNYELTDQVRTEKALQQAKVKLEHGYYELQQYNSEMNLLSEMSRALQACLTMQETYSPINIYCQQILTFTAGILYIMHPSRNYLEAVTSWGELPIKDSIFSPEQCWGLRNGQLYRADKKQHNLLCGHVSANEDERTPMYLCVPLMAQNDTLGLLYLELLPTCELPKTSIKPENQDLLVVTVAEQISLALANIRLRETLRFQSIRDPLTGLYNRRYLEESIYREIQRAERKRIPLAVIMLDVDHFKRFNDTHGHEAGDAVLRELGYVLIAHTRASDIACRYGGEEFVLFFYEAELEIALRRTEELRQAVRQIHIKYGSEQLSGITVSQGIALFPQHGNTAEGLINAADNALYQAKKSGRDKVIVYQAN